MRSIPLIALVVASCGGSKPIDEAGIDSSVAGDAAMGVDANQNDASQGDASCARLSGASFSCASDSDCPAPQPPQNLPYYCCGLSSPSSGKCVFPSIGSSTCTHGGCTTDTFQCDATSATTGLWHMCSNNSDCPMQRCCTVCRFGSAFSMCMSTAEAMKNGAACM